MGGGPKHKPTPRPAGLCLGSRSGGCRLPRACQKPQLRAPRHGLCALGRREGEARWHHEVPGVKAMTVTTETRTGGAARGGPGGEQGPNPLQAGAEDFLPAAGTRLRTRPRLHQVPPGTNPPQGSTTEDTWRSGYKNHHSDEVCRLRAAEVPPF